jgi:hypothetical protein
MNDDEFMERYHEAFTPQGGMRLVSDRVPGALALYEFTDPLDGTRRRVRLTRDADSFWLEFENADGEITYRCPTDVKGVEWADSNEGFERRRSPMPRKQKPPGKEKWTWDEINQGRKMSKTEKRYRRLAVNLGATKHDDGRIEPPKYDSHPEYWWTFIVLAIIVFVAFVFSVIGNAKSGGKHNRGHGSFHRTAQFQAAGRA